MAKGGPSAGSVVYSDVRQALASELEARRQLTRLQREMRQIERNEVMEANRSARAAAGVALRRDIDVRVGRDLTEKYKTVPYASEEEMVRLATQLQTSLDLSMSTVGTSWFLLFREMDEDASGRISFAELREACRKSLRLKPSELPDSKLASVWRTLDADASGFIDAGEFGRFMKLAPPPQGRVRISAAAGDSTTSRPGKQTRVGAGAAGDEEDVAAFSKRLAASGVEPASSAEMAELSVAFNRQLNRLPPDSREWYMLFKQMDADDSGIVTFDEFLAIIRGTLRLSSVAVPEASMHRLWLRLDENLSGSIDAGEFGRFMRLHMRHERSKRDSASRVGSARGARTSAIDATADPPSSAAAPEPASPISAAAVLTAAGHALAAGGVVAHKRSWRPGYKNSHEDVDPEEEEVVAFGAEVKRAQRERERMKEEAKQLEEQLKARRKTQPTRLPDIRPRGSKSAPLLPSDRSGGGSSRVQTGKRRKPSRMPPIDVLRAYGVAKAAPIRRSELGSVDRGFQTS